MSEAKRLANEAQAVFAAADQQNRALTPDERVYVEDLLERAQEAKNFSDRLGGISPDFNTLLGGGAGPASQMGFDASPRTPGEVFTASEAYKGIRHNRSSSTWTTGMIDTGVATKGTLMEGPGGGGGALAAPVPQVISGMVGKLFAPLTLEDLLLGGVATGPTVRYAVEGTATSGAAGVAEGGLKPESTIGYVSTDEPIKKIATIANVTDEVLEDAPSIQQLVNGRLALFVSIEAERQLLRGTSGGDEVQGLLTSRSVPIYAGGTAVGSKAVQLFTAMNGVRGSAFVEPEWIVMHPSDYADIRLATDNAGQFYGGGPFQGQYGNGGVAASGVVGGAIDSIWSKPVYVTATIGAGTALVGTRAGAQVWSRGGLSVEATNSHGDRFAHDITTIRAERRLGLTVFRPGAYCEVRLA